MTGNIIRPYPFPSDSVAFVYVFERKGLHKIGWSAIPARRIRQVELLVGSGVKAVSCYEMPQIMATIVEKAAHRALREFRVKGEWFSAPLPLIDAVIRAATVERQKMACTRNTTADTLHSSQS